MEKNLKPIFEGVLSVVKGERIGTITVSEPKVFDWVSKNLIGYGCFSNVLYMAMVDNLAEMASVLRENGVINDNRVYANVCDDKNYQWAFDLVDILTAPVLEQVNVQRDYTKSVVRGIYKFVDIYPNIYEDIAELYCEEKREFVKDRLADCLSAEDMYQFLSHNSLVVPF